MYYLITSHSLIVCFSLYRIIAENIRIKDTSSNDLNSYIFSFYHFLIYERRR